jgi:hypothetical protein
MNLLDAIMEPKIFNYSYYASGRIFFFMMRNEDMLCGNFFLTV